MKQILYKQNKFSSNFEDVKVCKVGLNLDTPFYSSLMISKEIKNTFLSLVVPYRHTPGPST